MVNVWESAMRLVIATFFLLLSAPLLATTQLNHLILPPGFHISVYASNVDGAREMALGKHGTVFVGSINAGGRVYALTDRNGDGTDVKVKTLVSGLFRPIGVAVHDGDLYVSAVSQIYVYPDIEAHLDNPPKPRVIGGFTPEHLDHGEKFLAFGPDGKLYVPIGAPCNVCNKKGFAKLTRMDPDGSDRQDVAYGIRNTVGFAWQPGSHALFFTNNGRDMLGDDKPDDTLNRVDQLGEDFGYPFCHAGDVLDPEYGKGKSCKNYAQPALKLGAHVAPLGMMFYTGDMFPKAMHGNIFIAEHGSWNRSEKAGPVGYRVMRVSLHGKTVTGYHPFVTGFMNNGQDGGRPVDVLQLQDGSLLISEDRLGTIYRVTYDGH